MKRFIFAMSLMLCVGLAANAQSRAIGGRLGHGIEFSYQHQLGSNMVNLQAGLPFLNGFGIEGVVTYDWIFPISSWPEKGRWNWYAGVGPGLGMYGFDHITGFVGVAGRIGVEYNFWFPMNISLDWRPLIGPYFNHNGAGFNSLGIFQGGIALSVRYLF